MQKVMKIALAAGVACTGVAGAALPSSATGPRTAYTSRAGLASHAGPGTALGRVAEQRVQDAWQVLAENPSKANALARFGLAMLAWYGTDRDADAFRDTAAMLRLSRQLMTSDTDVLAGLVPFLQAHQDLAWEMAFAVPGMDERYDPKPAYALLDRLREERQSQVERLPNLAVAIAVVHAQPLERRVNENRVKAADPVAIFDYYAANENKMFFGVRNMPVDLLVYVVDTTASIQEMNWALQRYAGNSDVGRLFFDVRYDYSNLEKFTTKQVTKDGYTLPNILKDGGVCADQAYFAMEVGKSIGVPTAYARGYSAESSHAWVGFLQAQGRRGQWNFDSGRYESYKGVAGFVMDPRTRKETSDASVSLLAEMIGVDPAARQVAAAMCDAGKSLTNPVDESNVRKGAAAYNVSLEPPAGTPARAPREANTQSALELIEMGLRHCEAYPQGWQEVAALAGRGELTQDQTRKWSDLVLKLCGKKYPDFAMTVLWQMIRLVKDPAEKNRLLEAAYGIFQSRLDLAAEIRMQQGRNWEEQGNLSKAGMCYEEVLKRYINASPLALSAVQSAEEVLKKMGQDQTVLTLYQQAAQMAQKPRQTMALEYLKQSNWYKLRDAYATKLEAAGRSGEAKVIRADLQQGTAGTSTNALN